MYRVDAVQPKADRFARSGSTQYECVGQEMAPHRI